MSSGASTESRYEQLVSRFLDRPNVTQESKGFGASALRVHGRIFAMLSSRSEFVGKLPKRRIEELIESGRVVSFEAGKGRPMKEWLVVPPGSPLDWTSIAEEALTFVGG